MNTEYILARLEHVRLQIGTHRAGIIYLADVSDAIAEIKRLVIRQDKVRMHIAGALLCLEECEDAAMHNKQRKVPNFNKAMELRSQLSVARVTLDFALASVARDGGGVDPPEPVPKPKPDEEEEA